MTAALKIEPVKVKTYVDRVESLEKEKQAIGDDVREVYDEAKKAGLNTKALRKIVAKRRAKAPDPQVEAAMHAYELALDEAAAMVSNGDVSLRAATARTGFSKSAIQRQVSHRKRDAVSGTEPPHDADGVTTGASPKPDAETIAWAEKVAAELPREPQSTRPLKDFIAERRAASTARATDEEARQEDDGEEAEASTPASGPGTDGIGCERLDLNQRPQGYEPCELPSCSTPRESSSTEQPPTKSETGAVARPASAERVAPNLYQRLTGAFDSKPREDDLDIPAFLDRRQRASAPSKE